MMLESCLLSELLRHRLLLNINDCVNLPGPCFKVIAIKTSLVEMDS